MKKTSLYLILSLLCPGLAPGADDSSARDSFSAETVADRLLLEFDVDRSDALNQLELAEAITCLRENRPLRKAERPATSQKRIIQSPPKVAVSMLKSYDTDADAQLTGAELTMAITNERSARIAMRRTNRAARQG